MSWFRPKTYGYGATPTTWQGWLAVAVFIAVEVALAWAILGFDDEAGAGRVILFLAVSAVLVIGFMRFSKARTSGEWRWRWGRGPSHLD
jgi:hypothetical protein